MTHTLEQLQEVFNKWRNRKDRPVMFSEPRTVLEIEEVLTWYYDPAGYTKADVQKILMSQLSMSASKSSSSQFFINPIPLSVQYSFKEISWGEVADILDTTIKYDRFNKLGVFACSLLTFTDSDQINVSLSSGSCTGKSYIVLEVIKFFPENSVKIIHYASPRSFFHALGRLCHKDTEIELESRSHYVKARMVQWDESQDEPTRGEKTKYNERRKEQARVLKEEWNAIPKIHVIDLERKLLVFLDQPTDELLQVLRPLLSHDKKRLYSTITDKQTSGAHRTKEIMIVGFPSVYYLSTKPSMDDQERTRQLILSGESTREKLNASLDQIGKVQADRVRFADRLSTDEARIELSQRAKAIKDSHITEVIIPEKDALKIVERFKEEHPDLSPRHLRDLPRLFGFIKAHALLNLWTRDREGSVVMASQRDIDEGYTLYSKLSESNELGIPPVLYTFWKDCIEPALESSEYREIGLGNEELTDMFHKMTGQWIDYHRLRDYRYLLVNTGRVKMGQDTADKRKWKLYCIERGIGKEKNPLDWLCVQPLQGLFTISQSDWDKYGAELERREFIVRTVGSHFEMTEKGRQAMQESES